MRSLRRSVQIAFVALLAVVVATWVPQAASATPAPGDVTGVVTDAEGAPLASASVYVDSASDTSRSDFDRDDVEADGTFTSSPSPGEYIVWASAPGFAPKYYDGSPTGTESPDAARAISLSVSTPGVAVTLALSPTAVPANDSPANAIPLLVPSTVAAVNTAATGDPQDVAGFGANSVWYQCIPEANGTLSFSTVGSYFDTLLAVDSVVGGAYTEIAVNDDEDPSVRWSEIPNVSVTAGVLYRIELAGYNSLRSGQAYVHVTGTTVCGDYVYSSSLNSSGASAKVGTGGIVTATVAAAGHTPAGTVTLSGSGLPTEAAALVGATATLAVPATLAAGSYLATLQYSGDATHASSSTTAAITVSKYVSHVTAKFSAKPTLTTKGKLAVVVKSSHGKAKGKVKVTLKLKHKKVTRTVKLKSGKAVVVLPKLAKKGTWKGTAVYTGDAKHAKASKSISVKIKKGGKNR